MNDNNPFKDVFFAICKILNINYDIIAERNHKELFTGKLHRVINKAIIIAAEEDTGTNDVLVDVGGTAGYAWNISPIDETDILRSVLIIGRKLHFPLDINFSALFALVSNNVESVVSYLRLTYSNRFFASVILESLSRIIELPIQKVLTMTDIL